MKIRFIHNAASYGFGHMAGEEIDCARAFGKEMIEIGLAIELDDLPGDLPHDFPGRKVLIDNGFESIREIKKIATPDQLTEIKGIGKKLAETIVNYLEKTEKK